MTIAALSPKEFQIFTGPPNVGEDVLSVPNGTVFDYNPTGTGFVHCHEKEIRFYENTEAEPVQCRADADIARVSFSPKGLSRALAEFGIKRCPPMTDSNAREQIFKQQFCSFGHIVNYVPKSV